MDRDSCEHGLAERRRAASADASRLLISPNNMAHFPECPHKDDSDYSRWAELDTPHAWERLGSGEQLPATGGARPDLVATTRCRDCVDHGPWRGTVLGRTSGFCQHHGAKRLADPGRAVDAPMYQVVKSGVAGEGVIARLKILPGWSAGAASWWSARAGFRPHAFGWIAWSLTTVWPPEPAGIRDCVRSGGFSTSMMPVRGAKRGAAVAGSGRPRAPSADCRRRSAPCQAMRSLAGRRPGTAS